MVLTSLLLSSVICRRCSTSLLERFKENGIVKYKCSCSQKIRTLLTCTYCKKQFLNLPYLIRKTSYCSLKCYWEGTYRKKVKNCQVCNKEFYIKAYLVKQGFGFYCSKECWFKLFKSWKVNLECINCKSKFEVLRSVYKKNPKYCSAKCRDDYRRDYVFRKCRKCKKKFEIPQSDINRGRGSFCTWGCFKRFDGETSIERTVRLELVKIREPFKQEMKFGRFHADFYLPLRKLVIECDGEYWHRSSLAKKRDYRKDQYLQKQGYRILRLTENTIRKGKLSMLKNLL